MAKQALRFIAIGVVVSLTFLAGCSQPAPNSKTGEQTKKAADKTEDSVVRPGLGEVSFTLPKGWIPVKQQAAGKTKDVESLSFIRKIDQSLWANPGPVGTA